MVVTTVPAKKKDWPKLQLGSDEIFRVTATPRFVARTTSINKASNSCSIEKQIFISMKYDIFLKYLTLRR